MSDFKIVRSNCIVDYNPKILYNNAEIKDGLCKITRTIELSDSSAFPLSVINFKGRTLHLFGEYLNYVLNTSQNPENEIFNGQEESVFIKIPADKIESVCNFLDTIAPNM